MYYVRGAADLELDKKSNPRDKRHAWLPQVVYQTTALCAMRATVRLRTVCELSQRSQWLLPGGGRLEVAPPPALGYSVSHMREHDGVRMSLPARALQLHSLTHVRVHGGHEGLKSADELAPNGHDVVERESVGSLLL